MTASVRQVLVIDPGATNPSATTYGTPFAAATLAGSTLVCFATCDQSAGGVVPSSVADAINGAYTAGAAAADPTNVASGVWSLTNAASLTNAQAITATYSTSVTYRGLIIVEVTGVPTSGVIVGSSAALNNSVAPGTNNITTGTAALGSSPILLLGVSQNVTGVAATQVPLAGTLDTSIATGWQWAIGQVTARVETQNVANPGTLAALFSSQGSDNYIGLMIGLLGVSSAPRLMGQTWL